MRLRQTEYERQQRERRAGEANGGDEHEARDEADRRQIDGAEGPVLPAAEHAGFRRADNGQDEAGDECRPGNPTSRAAVRVAACRVMLCPATLALPEVFAQLSLVEGWSYDRIESWLAETLMRLLLAAEEGGSG
ncbi:MAG TPA: hypothetical protein VF201_08855 [Nitrolancea sp.]